MFLLNMRFLFSKFQKTWNFIIFTNNPVLIQNQFQTILHQAPYHKNQSISSIFTQVKFHHNLKSKKFGKQ